MTRIRLGPKSRTWTQNRTLKQLNTKGKKLKDYNKTLKRGSAKITLSSKEQTNKLGRTGLETLIKNTKRSNTRREQTIPKRVRLKARLRKNLTAHVIHKDPH